MDDVVVKLECSGLGDENHCGAAELEVAFLVAFRVFFSGVRLDDGSHAERPDIHQPVASEIGVARENLPFVVGINVGAADEGYRIDGMIFSRNDADAFSCATRVGEVETVVIDGRKAYDGDIVCPGRCIVVKHLAEVAHRALERKRSVGIGIEVEHEPSVRRADHAVADRTGTGFQPAGEEVVERSVA